MRAWIGLILVLVAEAGPWAALAAYCLALPSMDQIDVWIETEAVPNMEQHPGTRNAHGEAKNVVVCD